MKRRRLPTVREEKPKPIRSSNFTLYVIVGITAGLSYVNSLDGEFVHDDIPAIVNNGDVTGSSSLQQVFFNDYWGTPMEDANSHKSYRPLTILSFRLNHYLTGLDPWWFHLWNVALHTACCVLVGRAGVVVARLRRRFAALAALLFALHPVHTEAVTGVVGRSDVLACIFFLGSLLAYHRPSNNKRYVWLSVSLGALSMLAKETGITVLFLNIVFDFYRHWPYVKRSLNSCKKKKAAPLVIRTLKVTICLAGLLCARLALLQGTLPTFSQQDNPAAVHPNICVRFMTYAYLAVFNCWLLLCPWTLSHDWQMGSVPLVTSVWDKRNLLTCVVFGTIMLLCCRLVNDSKKQKHRPAVVGLLLLVIPFVPASNLLFTVGFVVAERVLYIPSVGSVIITAYGAQLLWHSKPVFCKGLVIIGVAILATSDFFKTCFRNDDWIDRPTLLQADLATLPQNAKLHYNFGNFLRENGNRESAVRHYKEALRLWPSYTNAHNNMGTLVTDHDDELAVYHFLQAIHYNRFHFKAYYNLACVYKKNGYRELAAQMFEKCIYLRPNYVEAYVGLLGVKKDSEKWNIFLKVINMEPNNWRHYILFGNWLREKELLGEAAKYYLEAMRLTFKHRDLRNKISQDLIAFTHSALAYRSVGQYWKLFQLLTRWHTWRRGSPSYGTNLYLREWRRRVELEGRALKYSQYTNPVKTANCLDHKQLDIDSKPFATTIPYNLNVIVDVRYRGNISKSHDKPTNNIESGTKKICVRKCETYEDSLSAACQLYLCLDYLTEEVEAEILPLPGK